MAISIDQAQTGNNNLIVGTIESTLDGGQSGGILESDAVQDMEEYQTNNNRKLTVEQLKSASRLEWNEITSMMDRAMKYLGKHYKHVLAGVQN